MQKKSLEELAAKLNSLEEGPVKTGAEWFKVREIFIYFIIFKYIIHNIAI